MHGRSIFARLFCIAVLIGVPSAATAQDVIAYGGWTQDSLVPVGKVNAYLFTGYAGDSVNIIMGSKSFSFHPRIEVYAPTGVLLAAAVDSFNFATIRINSLKLPVSGVYTILALDCCAKNGGVYGLSLLRVNSGQNPETGDMREQADGTPEKGKMHAAGSSSALAR